MKLLNLAAGLALLPFLLCIGAAKEETTVNEGDAAPHFEAKTDSGETWNSKDYYDDKVVVLFFYPAAMTGGWTRQACAFRDEREKFADENVEVVGISGDEVAGLALFKKTENLNFPLLSDSDGAIAKAFGVPTRSGGSIKKTINGKEYTLNRGVTASRWTFIIIDGKVAMKNTKVNAAADSANVLKFLEDE